MSEEETKFRKRGPGRPRKVVAEESVQVDADPVAMESSEVLTKEAVTIRQEIETQRHLSEEEINKVLIGIEDQGNLYDLVRTMDEMALPASIKELQDQGRYRFRWLDATDQDGFYRQLHRPVFNWTLVNRMFPVKLPNALFDSNGAISRSRLVLSYMPKPIWDKWMEVKGRIANDRWQSAERKKKTGSYYDPVERGEATEFNVPADNSRFSGLVHEVKDTHPGGIQEAEGEYT